MINRCFIIFLISNNLFSFGQSRLNLIANGGFEINKNIPNTWGEAHLLKYWSTFYNGKWSPVTYFYDSEDGGYVPTWKEGGKQSPHSGYGFIGLGLSFRNKQELGSQYIESKLLSPLEKDSIYIISAFVSLADRLKYAIDYIPVALSDRMMLNSGSSTIYSPNVIKLKSNELYLDNTIQWMEVSAKYKAIGGEQFFLMGGIIGNEKLGTEFKIHKMSFRMSFHYILLNKLTFYFIDDISIKKQFQTPDQPEVKAITSLNSTIPEIEKIVLHDIIFKFNSYNLGDTSYKQLDDLVEKLKSCDICYINITGYTDNTGTQESNLYLSLMRAKAIYLYLEEKGISTEKMHYEGLGERDPIDNNNLPGGRLRNRRVEVCISKN